MYELLPIILGALFLGLGLFMLIAPNASLKPEDRGNPEKISKMQKTGIFFTICGAVFIVFKLFI